MILQWLYHFVISSRVCPAQCPDASTLSFLFFFFFLCTSVLQFYAVPPKNLYPIVSPHIFSPIPLHSSGHATCETHCTDCQQLVKCNLESTTLEIWVPRMPRPHLLLQPQQVTLRQRSGPHGACVQPPVGRAGRPGRGSVCRLPTAPSAVVLSGSRDSATTLPCAQVG